jgi:small subunit ribosomal protein S5
VALSHASRRTFHSSAKRLTGRSKGNPNKDRPLTRSDFKPKKFRRYDEEELKRLDEKYTPAQRAAIDAGELAITNKHLASQASAREAHWSLRYFDDLSKIDPVVDHPIRAPYSNIDPNLRLKTGDELDEDLATFIHNLPEDENSPEADEAWVEFDKKLRLTVGREQAERNPRSAEVPDLFRPGELNLDGKIIRPPTSMFQNRRKKSDEADPGLMRLMQMTGFSMREISSLRVKSIVSHRVVNQTRLGKISKMYYLSVAGNGNGLIGIGEGKSEESSEARVQSQYRAIRNMQPILRYEGRTIFGDVKAKVSATELELYARPPGKYSHVRRREAATKHDTGFGLRCQQYIWEICRCAGIADLAARVTRSRNPMNTAKATVEALLSQRDPEEIARARGKKMVDVRKVYYAGLV